MSRGAETRGRIVRAAAGLLAEGGREAVSTRAVAAAAGVQAPTIYRQFGDMRGLLDEVASYGFSTYLRDKASQAPGEDPVEDLRRGWDLHVRFGLENPAFYALMYGDPRPGKKPRAAVEAAESLLSLVRRVAEAGRLRVGAEQAARMIQGAGSGVILALVGTEPEHRDLSLSEMTRDAILAAITTDEPGPNGDGLDRISSRAVALEAVLPAAGGKLTPGERAVLSEWLDRLARP